MSESVPDRWRASDYAGVDPMSLYGKMERLFQCAGGCGTTIDILGEAGPQPRTLRISDDFELFYYCPECQPEPQST